MSSVVKQGIFHELRPIYQPLQPGRVCALRESVACRARADLQRFPTAAASVEVSFTPPRHFNSFSE